MLIHKDKKIYKGSAGIEIRLDTKVDCTSYATKEIKVKKPDGNPTAWVATAVDGEAQFGELVATKNVLKYTTLKDDLNQATTELAKYMLQAYIFNNDNDNHRGLTVELEVFDVFT